MFSTFNAKIQTQDPAALSSAPCSQHISSSPGFLMENGQCLRPLLTINPYFAPVLPVGLGCPVSFILPVLARPGRLFPKG